MVAWSSPPAVADALKEESFTQLMQGQVADILFTDPPYNVKIDGHVCGLGRVKHREFAVASDGISKEQFSNFLAKMFGHASAALTDGAIAYIRRHWWHMGELLAAGAVAFDASKNLVVWNKTNGRTGSFYRSTHGLIFMLKEGKWRAHLQFRLRRNRALSHQCLGLSWYQQPGQNPG